MKMKTKMKSKMDEKWMKNLKANCERPYYDYVKKISYKRYFRRTCLIKRVGRGREKRLKEELKVLYAMRSRLGW